jgi:virginiamycin B lyase
MKVLAWLSFASVVLLLGILLMVRGPAPTVASPTRDLTSTPPTNDAAVFLFDPFAETYVFTYTLPPGSGSMVWDVATSVDGEWQDVWFTEPDLDLLHHLVYTDTHDYAVESHPLPPGSYPLNLLLVGNEVWLTLPGRNRIGRFHKTTRTWAEYELPTADAYPADLTLASDGSVWFTEMWADKLGRVTRGSQPTVEEYDIPALEGGRPYGIAWLNKGIYVAQTVNDVLTRYNPSTGQWINIRGVTASVPDHPFRLAVEGARVWATERSGNRITFFEYGTYSVALPYEVEPAGSMPMDLVLGGDGRIWFTQWGAGRIGALDVSPTGAQREYFSLPGEGRAPGGIATNPAGKLWITASGYYRLHLPLVMDSF